ncbi:MAG: DUF3073 domain-containing protein [Mycobacteriales bacterium]
MGRGRAKAKQTKVARQLKYSSGGTDLDRLRAELTANGDGDSTSADDGVETGDVETRDDEFDGVDGDADDEDARLT